jgi:hypothetical protein
LINLSQVALRQGAKIIGLAGGALSQLCRLARFAEFTAG